MKKIMSLFRKGIISLISIILLNLAISLITMGKINFLLWLIIPSIIFEQVFETCCYDLSNNEAINLTFAVLFWAVLGIIAQALIMVIKEKGLKKYIKKMI